jgi:hypothetical protein
LANKSGVDRPAWRHSRPAWRHSRPARLIAGCVIGVLLPAGIMAVLVAGSLATWRAVQAAEGHGTRGSFVVSVQRSRGEFRLPDGQITRQNVSFAGSTTGLSPGQVVPALDTGDVTYVFPRHGSRHWVSDAATLAVTVVALGAWIWLIPVRWRRRRRPAAPAAAADVGSGLTDLDGLGSDLARERAPAEGRQGNLTVLAAASSPAWVTAIRALLNADISTLCFNAALRKATDRSAYPIRITVAVALTDLDRAISPISGESERLSELRTVIAGLVSGHGALAGTYADSKAWLFTVYTGHTDWLGGFESAVRAELSDHQVGFAAHRDGRWRTYREFSKAAPSPARARIVLGVFPLGIALITGSRYGAGWAAASGIAVLAWIAPVMFVRDRNRVLAAQMAHPGATFMIICAVFLTLFFPLGAFIVHPASPWICGAGAAVVAVALTGAMWPAQRRFYDRIQAQAALHPPADPPLPH